MTPEQVDAAMPHVRAAQAAGLLTFPVRMVAGQKKPAYRGWQRKAWDPGMLEEELKHPKCFGYGVTLPKSDPRRVVDLDLDDGGEGLQAGQTPWQDRLAAVEAEHEALPATKTTETPSGGQHRWFLWPEEVALPGGSWHGFTVRKLHGATNFVVGPGSVRADGKAYVNPTPGTPIATMPVALARSGIKGMAAADDVINVGPYELPEAIEQGDCHRQVCKYTLSLWDRRLSIWRDVDARPRSARAATGDETYRGAPAPALRQCPADLETKYPRDQHGYLAGWANQTDGSESEAPKAHPASGGVPEHLTRQSRAAWHFARLAGDRVRFDHGRRRWLTWSGHRWRPDVDGTVERLWLSVLADRYRNALAIADSDTRKKTLEAIQSAGATNGAISSGLEIASNMEPIATAADAWDPDPWLLCCENGVVDLRTGQLRDGRPEDMISRSTGIAYDRGATAPRWTQFLSEVFAGDVELIDWFNRLIGASLIGLMFELLAIWHGLGNNGKSVATKVLRHAFGEYAVVIAVETLVNAKRSAGDATPDLIPLRGARIAFTSEPDQSAKLRGGTLKRLASIDRMSGRPLFGDTQTWDPTHSIHLATNHLPEVEDVTEGYWRRIALVPWTVRFRKPDDDGDGLLEDDGLATKLEKELAGILAWAIRGAVAYAAGTSLYPLPAAVRAGTTDYRNNSDLLGQFIAEKVIYETDAAVGLRELHGAYRSWCDEVALSKPERLRERQFLAEFEEHGKVERTLDTHRNRTFFAGVRLRLSTDCGDAESQPSNSPPFPASSGSERKGNTSPNFRNPADSGEPEGVRDMSGTPVSEEMASIFESVVMERQA